MTKKRIQTRYISISLIFVLISSMSFFYYNKKKESKFELNDKQISFSIDQKNFIMPSPFHSFHYLNGMNFQWKNLAEISSAGSYPNETQTALVLGSKAADGIVFLFANEKEKARQIRSTVIDLTENLGINTDIKDAISDLDQAVILNQDKTILEDKIVALQYQTEKALQKKNKANLANLVELGGWLEGLYLTSKGIIENYNPDHSEILKQSHVAQIYTEVLTALLDRADNVQEKKLLENILTKLMQISNLINHPHPEPFPLEKVKELYKISSDIKNLIESKDDNQNK